MRNICVIRSFLEYLSQDPLSPLIVHTLALFFSLCIALNLALSLFLLIEKNLYYISTSLYTAYTSKLLHNAVHNRDTSTSVNPTNAHWDSGIEVSTCLLHVDPYWFVSITSHRYASTIRRGGTGQLMHSRPKLSWNICTVPWTDIICDHTP